MKIKRRKAKSRDPSVQHCIDDARRIGGEEMAIEVSQRRCGPCTICCFGMEVQLDDGEMKPHGVWCKHVKAGIRSGCGIYANRPEECRVWLCSWRRGIGKRTDRPDLIGAFAHMTPGEMADGSTQTCIHWKLMPDANLKALGEIVAILWTLNPETPMAFSLYPYTTSARDCPAFSLADLMRKGLKTPINFLDLIVASTMGSDYAIRIRCGEEADLPMTMIDRLSHLIPKSFAQKILSELAEDPK